MENPQVYVLTAFSPTVSFLKSRCCSQFIWMNLLSTGEKMGEMTVPSLS